MTSANRNQCASDVVHDLGQPFAEGAFRLVAMSTYTEGPRTGQPCVVKWFKTGEVYEDDFYEMDIMAVDKAQELIDAFNEAEVIGSTVRLNHPEVWTVGGGRQGGQRVLVEPFIRNFEKYNSNTGHVLRASGWSDAMQALSHFSYHKSGGQLVLCDLQGGVTRRGMLLTDPVILSRRRTYGVTDLGAEGMSTFFARHECNEYCSEHWQMPRDRTVYYGSVASTSMVAWGGGGGGGGGAAALGAVYEEDEEENEDTEEDEEGGYSSTGSCSGYGYGYGCGYGYGYSAGKCW